MLVDANLLLCVADAESRHCGPARRWLSEQLEGPRRVGLPWQTLATFLRIATLPRLFARPLTAIEAWGFVHDLLAQPVVWTPEPGSRYPDLLGALVRDHDVRGNLVPDAQLAALALEHGLCIYSADSDFARFPEVRWVNPLHA